MYFRIEYNALSNFHEKKPNIRQKHILESHLFLDYKMKTKMRVLVTLLIEHKTLRIDKQKLKILLNNLFSFTKNRVSVPNLGRQIRSQIFAPSLPKLPVFNIFHCISNCKFQSVTVTMQSIITILNTRNRA